MLRLPAAAILALAPFLPLGRTAPTQTPGAATTIDTIQAGDPRVETDRLRPFAIERRLTLSRGDSAQPFGRQSESLAPQTLDGRPVLLGVVTFETPRATTVDSSWLEAATLSPIRMQSSNAERSITLQFEGDRVRSATRPSNGAAETSDRRLGVRPFEWNMFGLALSALPLQPGFRAAMPVYIDRFKRAVWYRVEVVRDTVLVRSNGHRAPMWEVLATADSAAPSARFWVSQRHRFVDQVRVWEPGVAIMYDRGL
jgi:hypothetical protein